MARRRRESNDAPMSFFSFQDIIACTTGIMVLITLMLTLELIAKKSNGDDDEDLTPLKNAVAAAEKKRDDMKEKNERAQKILDNASGGVFVTEGTVRAIDRAVRNLKRENEVMAGKVARIDDERLKLDKAITQVGDAVATLTEENATLAKKVERNKKRTRVTVIGGEGQTKRALFVEVGATVCVVATIPKDGENKGFAEKVKQFPDPQSPLKSDPNWDVKFIEWARGLSKDKDCFVLLVRPDAVEKWQIVAGELKIGEKFDVGWDVWPADKSLLGGP